MPNPRVVPISGGWRSVVSMRSALLALVALAFLAGILPAGFVLDRWLTRELERRAHRDLTTAPNLIAARDAALHDAMMMHAKELAHETALLDALRSGDRGRAISVLEPGARAHNYGGVLLGGDGTVWLGPSGSAELAAETRQGGMPVRIVSDDQGLHLVSVAPVMHAGEWLGAAGVALPLDSAAAGTLAALTHSDLVLLLGSDARWAAAPGGGPLAADIARAWLRAPGVDSVRELRVAGGRYLASAAELNGATAIFVRDLRRELALIPRLRGVALVTGAGALLLALIFGYLLAGWLAQPVRQLASAAGRLSAGDFDAPLPGSSLKEVARVTTAFADMRKALALRLDELRSANRLLEERQIRLSALQSELIKRERVATSARMAAELAHEIRNPVANIRNCLELLERRLGHDEEGREFAALAIEELLRMHELAERMLHLNQPRGHEGGSCDAVAVARDVMTLMELGSSQTPIQMSLEAVGPIDVAMPADALKQVLLNLLRNARDARADGLVLTVRVRQAGRDVCIDVCDNGPGIPSHLHDRVFDPFFTTRAHAGGVGLGLFLVEGIVRGHGGSVALQMSPGTQGACFELKIPAAHEQPQGSSPESDRVTADV